MRSAGSIAHIDLLDGEFVVDVQASPRRPLDARPRPARGHRHADAGVRPQHRSAAAWHRPPLVPFGSDSALAGALAGRQPPEAGVRFSHSLPVGGHTASSAGVELVTGAGERQTAVASSAVGILDLPCSLAERKEVIQ
jgi:hypothetical protein